MSDDWESAADEVSAAPAALVNQWEGEDEEDAAAPDAWDADPEEPKKKSDVEVTAVEKKKAVTKRALAKKEEEERKLAEKLAKSQLGDSNYLAQERERLRRLEEDRDAALAGDLFGSESVKPKDATSDLPGSKPAAASSASSSSSSSTKAGYSVQQIDTSSSAAADLTFATTGVVMPNSLLRTGAKLDEAQLDTDADVDKFCLDLGKRLEKLGKSALASKKICKLIAGITEESIKLGVLRLDDVGELKRIMTVKHNDLTTKQKKGDKKGANKVAAAKPVVALARNAFMHGDNFGSHADEDPADYDFI